MFARISLYFLALACWTCLNACELDTVPSRDAAQITSFDLLTGNNPELTEDVTGVITDTTITLNVPANTDLTSLVPTIQHNGAFVSPAAGAPQDFSDPVDYSVGTASGNAHTYRVTVVSAASSSKDVKGFRVDSVPGVIDGTNITLTLPFGTDLSMLRGFVSYTGESVTPESGSIQDFSAPVEYTVTAQDGSSRTYTVTVATAPSNAKEITALSIDDVTADINGTLISLTLPHGTDLHALEPAIVYTGASISPESGSAQDLSEPITYTVTAADGSTKDYVLTVSVAQSDSKEITKFSWNGRTASITGDAIALTVPYGTDVTNLAPTIMHSGKSVSPASGVVRDFSQPREYTVTAADGSTRKYTVTFNVAPSTAHEISEFRILDKDAQMTGTMITLSFPFGTDATSLVPTIVHNGESIMPPSGVAQDFSAPVSYTVKAANGTTKVYTVTVTVAKSSAREITKLKLLGVDATIMGEAINVVVPYGSDITSVAPEVMHNGAGIEPAASAPQNFSSSSVLYTVTASDGQTRLYTVTVKVASSKEITAFSILGVPGTFGPNSIALTMPHGSNLSMLEPSITVATGVTVSPTGKQDFSAPVTYTVKAEDNSTKDYVVAVSVATPDAKEITRFVINGVAGKISPSGISITLPNGTDVTTLKPTITITGKSVSPQSGAETNFTTNPVMYTVTDSNDMPNVVPVTVTLAGTGDKDITGFSILGVPATITTDTITLTLPYGTNPALLTPTLQTTGKSVSPATLTPRNFATTRKYTVTAADLTTKDYTVTVNIAALADKDILGFDILGVAPTTTSPGFTVTLPTGTNVTGLMPIVAISGASVSPISGQATNFTQPAVYTVTGADNMPKQYTVTVEFAP